MEELRRRYLQLVRDELPSAGRHGRWVLAQDHCFGRVLLDNVLGRCWYDVLAKRRPAYRPLRAEQLRAAVELGEALLAQGDPMLRELNEKSLQWRGKLRSG